MRLVITTKDKRGGNRDLTAERAVLGGRGGVAAGGPQSELVPPVRLRRRARLTAVGARHTHAAVALRSSAGLETASIIGSTGMFRVCLVRAKIERSNT
jgi:hypothetical protein